MQFCFLKQFFLSTFLHRFFPEKSRARSQFNTLSVQVSPILLSLYVQSLPVLLTHCKWLIQSRELYLFLFVEQMLLCDIGLPDLSFNDAYYWIEVAIAYIKLQLRRVE